jgi:hypothetical protein
MRRLFSILLAVCLFASTGAQAKILIINCQHTAAQDAASRLVELVWDRWMKVTGIQYDVYPSNYLVVKIGSGIYTHHGTAGSDSLDLWDVASQGGYTEAIALNLPNNYYWNTRAKCTTIGMPYFVDYINRNAKFVNGGNSAAFPIPLILPYDGAPYFTLRLGPKFTGVADTTGINIAALSDYQSFLDAEGDSIYITTLASPYVNSVATTDSASWVYPIYWRDVVTRRTLHNREAWCWMTKGAGNHRIIWMVHGEQDVMATMWPAVLGMFEKITPIEFPILALHFGKIAAPEWGASLDTVGLGANFKAIKDYAVANGMKIDLLGLVYNMKEVAASSNAVNRSTAYNYMNAWPNNIRITLCSYESWKPTTYYDWIGSINGASNSEAVSRIKYTQDSTSAPTFYPNISTTRADVYGGYFVQSGTLDRAYDALVALASRGITDIYASGKNNTTSYPGATDRGIIGSQRTWIGTHELRIHAYSGFWRYTLEGAVHNADSLRVAYLSRFASYRADFMRKLLPYTIGTYTTLTDDSGIAITAANGIRVSRSAQYNPGMVLNALTFTGGAGFAVPLVGTSATRSLFLDVMKMMNNQVKMGNYIIDTYGTVKQPAFIYSWMEDVKMDRRNGHKYSGDNVRME